MSWPGEDWTVGLSGHVQQKVKQLQAQNEKLTKERQQRQLQLDNTEAALHKQKQKYEEVRVELAALQRELGGVREAAEAEVRVRERVAHDLQVKTGQAHSLEGQLESSKNLVQSLSQEIKRLEAELEKLQKGNGSGDSLLFSTPCWNMSSPWDQSGGFRAEGDGKAQHVRQQLHFGEIPKPVSGGASSPFPQLPQKSPPLRRHVRQAEASTPSSLFPWEREDLWPTPKGQPAPSVASGGVVKSSDSGIEEALRNEIDGLRVRVSDLQRETLLESERLKDVESRLAQAQRDINTKELSLTRTQDQLTRAQTRISQETDRVQTAEQKVKQLQEELKCQRQNAESSRCNAEQRRKDMEREHQRELLEQQRERQALEKQHQQEINRHNQEIQQARTLHNTLQAQHDKVCAQKQCLERDLEDLRGKLKNTETDLRESQKRETQTEAKLTESLRENENLTVSLAQVKKQERVLQEEVKRLTDELADALKLIKELQAQLAAPPQPLSVPHFGTSGDCFAPSVSLKHDRSPPYQPSTQRKRVPQTGRTREEERMKYPSGREPGEGMDSEHIGSEDSQKLIAKGAVTQQSSSLKRSDTDVDVSLTEQDTGIEDVDTDSLMSDSTISLSSKSESGIDRHFQDDTRGNVDTRDTASLKDLKKENSELRDELRDVKYELQKRLEDLESQRKAETEARTKLKQLSRKHSNQTEQQRAKALELKDTLTKLEVQLEQEKQDNTKLRETLNVFEREVEVRQEEKERDQYESTELKEVLAEMEQKERFMEEEIKRMRTELEDIQLKLKQEREERKREKEEEREKFLKEEAEGLKIAQLQEELDNLRRFGQLEETSRENLPVAYLQLNRHLNSNNKDLVPTPDSICDSVNLHNTIICKESSEMEVIMDLGAQTKPGKIGEGKTEIEEPLAISSKTTDLEDSTVLVLEIERLRVERDRESEKTKQAQGKLEVLQKQVNTQTKHLTQAFESQSKNIENLLRELHDKECAHQKQSEELQKCQEKISLLEEVKNTREVVEFSEISTLLEPLREISRDLSCDSAISNMSICDQEMFNDDTPQDSQPSLQLPIEHSVSRNTEQTNTRDTLDKQQISTELWNPLCLNCQCPLSTNVSSQGNKHSQVGSKNAQDTENSSVSSHSQDKHSEVLNIPENSTKDDFELERLTKELQEAEVQLNVMKTQNESLGLVKEELLSVKRENEELKARLRFVDTFADKTTKQNENAENNDLNEEGFQDGTSSGQEESLGPDENSKDEEMKGMKTTAEVHSLHKQIQILQEQIQNLSEQNRAQAEELNLWKISTKGETEDSSSPSIIQSEFEIFLPCNSNKPCAQQQGTPMQYTKDTTQHGAEDGHEQTSSHETQMRHDGSISQGPQGQVTETEKPMITENPQECGTSFVNHNDKTPAVCTSDARNTEDVLSDLHQIALMSPVCQTNRTGAGANSQEDALIDISFPSEYQTKAILFKPIKEPCENHDSQNPDLLTVHNQIKTTETFALDKHGYRRGDATDKHDHHAAKVVPSSSTNESYKGHRAESEVNIDCKRIEGEVQSVSTQTEESEEMTERAVKRPLVHISTQTDNGQLEIEEDEVEKDPVELPTSSHTIQYVTNQLLSKAFPMSDPAHLAKRIRQNRNRMSAAYDDTEYEPYGLPEVVMKGFADIPSGPACPYVLRRGLLGTEAMPLPLKEGTPQDENEDIEP